MSVTYLMKLKTHTKSAICCLVQDIKAGPNDTLLYKVPSNSTGKNFVTNVYKLLLPVEFITKYFK